MKRWTWLCSSVLLALVISSCSPGAPGPGPDIKPTLGQPTLENPDAEGEDMIFSFPVTGNPTVTLETSVSGNAAGLSSSSLRPQKNYVGHVTLIKQRTVGGSDEWIMNEDGNGGVEFRPAPGANPKTLRVGFEDLWGDDEVKPDETKPEDTNRNFVLTARVPGLTPVVLPVLPKKYKWDASIVKKVITAPVAGGSGLFELNITHNGPSSVTILPGQLKIMDPVLAPLTLNAAGSIAANAPFWTCINVGNILGCMNSGPITTSTTIPPVKVLVNAPAGSAGKVWTNCGYIRSYDKVLTNNRSCIEGQIKPNDGKLDFAIKKELVKPLILGGQGTYSLTVTNVGTVPAPSPTVQVIDPMPAGLTLNPAPPVIAGWDCSASTPALLSCKYIGPVPAQIVPSASSTLTFTVDVSKDLQGEVKNCARVRVDGDVNPQNDEACIFNTPTGETPKFDLTLKKQTEKPLDNTGAGLFLLTPVNAGPNPVPAATPITVIDPMPSGLSLVLPAAVTLNTPNWNCAASTAASLSCTYTGSYPIPVGAFASIQVPVQRVFGVPLAGENCARIVAPGETVTTNNGACTSIVEAPKVDLVMRKTLTSPTGAAGVLIPGGTATFTLSVLNNASTLVATNLPITVTDSLPAALTLNVALANSSNLPDWNCSASTVSQLSCTLNASALPWAASAIKTLSVPVLVSDKLKAERNCAFVAVANDISPNDNNGCVGLVYQNPAKVDLAINKVQDFIFAPGQSGDFTLTVENQGSPVFVGPITVTDPMPAGFTLNVAATNTASVPDWNCSASTVSTLSCTYVGSFPIASGAFLSPIKVKTTIALRNFERINCASVTLAGDVDSSDDRKCIDIKIGGVAG